MNLHSTFEAAQFGRLQDSWMSSARLPEEAANSSCSDRLWVRFLVSSDMRQGLGTVGAV